MASQSLKLINVGKQYFILYRKREVVGNVHEFGAQIYSQTIKMDFINVKDNISYLAAGTLKFMRRINLFLS